MSAISIDDRANALLKTHGWKIEESIYSHVDGFEFEFSEKSVTSDGSISPSCLSSFQGCRRKLYLHRNPNDSSASYVNLIGEKKSISHTVSLPAIEGSIIHTALFCITNFVLKRASDLVGLGWRTMLAPVIHYSIFKATNEFGYRGKHQPQLLGELGLTPKMIERHITKVASHVWARKVGNFRFDKREWRSQLGKLPLDGEVLVSRNGMFGFCDLQARNGGEVIVVEYKTGRLAPASREARLTDEKTHAILHSSYHDLYHLALQLSCYCWMISEKETCSRAWLVRTRSDPLEIIEFVIGDLSKLAVSEITQTALKELNALSSCKTAPSGRYDPNSCGWCGYRMNCPAFLSGTSGLDFERWFKERPLDALPTLLPVLEIRPEESTVVTQKGEESLPMIITGSHTGHLNLAQDNIDQGHELVIFTELRGSLQRPFSHSVDFARCG